MPLARTIIPASARQRDQPLKLVDSVRHRAPEPHTEGVRMDEDALK